MHWLMVWITTDSMHVYHYANTPWLKVIFSDHCEHGMFRRGNVHCDIRGLFAVTHVCRAQSVGSIIIDSRAVPGNPLQSRQVQLCTFSVYARLISRCGVGIVPVADRGSPWTRVVSVGHPPTRSPQRV